ncbi:MAG: insulinase family protein [Desulfobulbaceae bacterium]|nr:insulinase family protein [Desulfobulbaceae bacterium]
MIQFAVGTVYNGFLLNRMEYVPEIDSTVLQFTHQILGTPAFAIKNKDINKTFCIAFQTLPEDSTGVAHILEHSVLMGSEKYPVKDVFGEINKSGLMTFLNAMTGSDTTWYPYATRNLTEYFNIMDVYCDVVFNPLLQRSTFEQEGWHYHKEADDQPLQFHGVVFNEMKGAFSDPLRSLFHHMFKGLMPGSTYAHESGGDPKHIPDLTYEQFVDFHRRYYHPSNATLFFYGDANLEEELAFVEHRFLRRFHEPREKSVINKGENIAQPVLSRDGYGVQPGADRAEKTFLAVGSAVGTVLDRERNTAFQVIANILYNSDASPLKKAILTAGLCRDFGGLFLPNSCYTTIMMTYLIGSEPHHLDQFRETYQTVLKETAAVGLDHELVLSELNKYEFSVREEMTKAQRGLDLISKALPALKHEVDPFDALRIDELFQTIRKKALEERYFEQLIEQYLLANPATVEIILEPDPEKMAQTYREEQDRLQAFARTLDKKGKQDIIRRTRELMELQNQPNDEDTLRLLPKLNVGDLKRTLPFHEAEPQQLEDRLLLVNRLPTNGIAYIDFGFDCLGISQDLLPLLNLFGTIMTEIGTHAKDYMQLARELGIYTGGLSHSFNTYKGISDPDEATRPVLWLHLKALSSYLEPALALVKEIFSDLSLENRQRIREIVLREFAWTEHSVQSEGYSLASSRVFSHLSVSGKFNEYVNGTTAYLYLKNLANNYQAREESFLKDLKTIRDLLLRKSGLILCLTGSDEDSRRFVDLCPAVTESLNDLPSERHLFDFPLFPPHEGLCTSAEVVFNVQGCSLFSDPQEYSGHFEVLKTWISRDYLWNTVRQMGGAYGCFVQFNHLTGNFGIISYRDPQISKTFAAYDRLRDHIDRLDLSPHVMQQLIIGTYGNLDPHQAPAVKGAVARNEYLTGITREFKQKRIDEVLATSTEDLRGFASLFDRLVQESYRTTIGNCEKIKANAGLFSQITEL